MSCSPKNIIKPAKGYSENAYPQGDTSDIITTIMRVDAHHSQAYINTTEAACLRGDSDRSTLRNVWAFVKNNVRYKADSEGLERVQTPGGLFSRRQGDCKSFSIALVALLRALGYTDIYYRFTAYRGKNITHVYVVVRTSEGEYILDSVHSRFDDEVAYTYKKDMPAAVIKSQGISGLPQINGTFERMWKGAILAAGIFTIYKLSK